MLLNKTTLALVLTLAATAASAAPRDSKNIHQHLNEQRDGHAHVSSAHDIHREAQTTLGTAHLNYHADGDPVLREMQQHRSAHLSEATEAHIHAYEEGVKDTLEDLRGRMRAQQGYVWEPPIVEYVNMPGIVRNGALYPSHKAPVVISPGRWVEANSVALPSTVATPKKRQRVVIVK